MSPNCHYKAHRSDLGGSSQMTAEELKAARSLPPKVARAHCVRTEFRTLVPLALGVLRVVDRNLTAAIDGRIVRRTAGRELNARFL